MLLELSPVVSNVYTSNCSGPYRSNPPFQFCDIWVLWRSEHPNVKKMKKGRLDQYGAECYGGLIFATMRKSVGLKGLIDAIFIVMLHC